MYYLMLALCAISFTASVFLISKFGIKRKDSIDFVTDNKSKDGDI